MNCIGCPLKNDEVCPGGNNPTLCTNETFLNKLRKGVSQNLPSIWQQAANFAGAVVNHIQDGMVSATPEEIERRRSICNGCDRFREIDDRCLECGCFLSKKIQWNSEACPLGKWKLVVENKPDNVVSQQKGGCGCGGVISS